MQIGTKVALAVVIAIIAATAGMQVARWTAPGAPQLQSGTWLPAARATLPFSLTDQQGRAASEQLLQGRATLLFFGFSNCPDVCPTTLALLASVRKSTALKPLQVVMVSIDPERDTPRQLQRYLSGFDPSFIGLTGAPAAVDGLTKAFSAAAFRQPLPGGDYSMDHSATVYLLDRQGRLVAVFTPPLSLEKMRQDLDALRDRLG
jgi:protein SCO1/2